MPDILVFCEKDEVAFELLSWGKKVKDSLNVKASCGGSWEQVPRRKLPIILLTVPTRYTGAKIPCWRIFMLMYIRDALFQIAKPTILRLILSRLYTDEVRNWHPGVAQKWDAGCITDAIGCRIVKDKEMVVSRYTLGGNTIFSRSIENSAKKVISVLPKTFELGTKESRQGEAIEASLTLKESKRQDCRTKTKQGDTVSLEDAQTLICVGRGLNKKEDMAIVEGWLRY